MTVGKSALVSQPMGDWSDVASQVGPLIRHLVEALLPRGVDGLPSVNVVAESVERRLASPLSSGRVVDLDHLNRLVITFTREEVVTLLIKHFQNAILRSIHAQLKHQTAAVRSKVTPSEVWQDSRMQALQLSGDFVWSGEKAFRAWAALLTRNVINSRKKYWNSQRRKAALEMPLQVKPDSQDLGGAPHPVASVPSPSRVIAGKETFQRVLDLMEHELTERERTALRLRYLEGQSVGETARVMNATAGAVKMLCQRGIARVRRRLE